jgi:hypothetical protein
VTQGDWITLASTFTSDNGAIAKAWAVATSYTNVDVYVAVNGPSGVGADASPALKADLVAFLDSKAMIPLSATILDAQFVGFNISMYLTVAANYVGTTVQAQVLALLNNYLSFANQTFGGTLHTSDIGFLLSTTPGVQYFNLTAFYAVGNTLGVYDTTAAFNQIFEPGIVNVTLVPL